MPKFATLSLAFIGLLNSIPARAGDEPAIQGEGRALPYLRALHAKMHRYWADNFLAMASTQLPKEHAINVASRAVDLEVVLSAEGKLANVKVVKASGSAEFDTSAIDVVKAAAPFVLAPEEVLSDDGKVHVLWTLARDDRRCAGLSILIKTIAVGEAVPMLVAHGRESVAIARLQAADEKEREAVFSAFARAWLDRSEDDKELAIRVAMANAWAGDERGAERLRKALEKWENLDLAARGLSVLKTPLCPFVKNKLDDSSGQARMDVLTVLRFGPDGDCLPWMVKLAKDRQAPLAERLLAIETLGSRGEPEVMAALKDLLKESTPTIQAAAILAEARAGAGKGAVFRLTALLRDPSIEVRTASAAALVRVGGEAALPQLFLLSREKNPRPYEAVANELASLSGEASADLLGRFLRKDDRRIRVASARALARRHDAFAMKFQTSLGASRDAELRFLAGTTIDAEKRVAAASAPEGYPWTDSCAALAEGNGKIAAVDWLLAQFPKLEPTTRIDLMGMWLAANRTKN
jgi:TonB family protein